MPRASPGSRAPTTSGERPDLRATAPSPTPTSSSPRTSTSPTPPTSATPILDDAPDIDGLRVELGGFIFAEFEEPNSEAFGLAFAVVILIVAFGSVLAMGLPVAVALFGIGIGGAGVILFSNVIEVPEFAPVHRDHDRPRRRHRLRAAHRHAVPGAAPRRPHRARVGGRSPSTPPAASVLFAGATVVISVLGMLLMGIGFVQGLAVTRGGHRRRSPCVASLTLLPALLGFAGENIERTKRRGLIAAGLVAVGLVGFGLDIAPLMAAFPAALVVLIARVLRPGAASARSTHRPPKPRRETLAYRWSRVIQHRPWPFAHRRHRRPARPRRAGAQPAAGLLRREQLRRGHHHAAGLRPARRRLRRRASTARCSSSPRWTRGRRPRGAGRRQRGRGGRSRRRPPSSARQPNEDGTAVRWFVAPRPTGRRRRPPRRSCTASATTCSRPVEDGHRRRHQGDRHRGRQHRRLRRSWPSASRSSSAPC